MRCKVLLLYTFTALPFKQWLMAKYFCCICLLQFMATLDWSWRTQVHTTLKYVDKAQVSGGRMHLRIGRRASAPWASSAPGANARFACGSWPCRTGTQKSRAQCPLSRPRSPSARAQSGRGAYLSEAHTHILIYMKHKNGTVQNESIRVKNTRKSTIN